MAQAGDDETKQHIAEVEDKANILQHALDAYMSGHVEADAVGAALEASSEGEATCRVTHAVPLASWRKLVELHKTTFASALFSRLSVVGTQYKVHASHCWCRILTYF